MMLFHQLFSRKIQSSDRWDFLRDLTLDQETFSFFEELPGHTLRALRFQQGKVTALLDESLNEKTPRVHWRHSVLLPEVPSNGDKLLTDWLFPFPWSAILNPKGSPGTALEFSDQIFKNQCDNLRNGIEQLERKLLQGEIACLEIKTPGVSSAFIFHCVRGKIIRGSYCSGFVLSEHKKILDQTSHVVAALQTPNHLDSKGFICASSLFVQALETVKEFRPTQGIDPATQDDPLEL